MQLIPLEGALTRPSGWSWSASLSLSLPPVVCSTYDSPSRPKKQNLPANRPENKDKEKTRTRLPVVSARFVIGFFQVLFHAWRS